MSLVTFLRPVINIHSHSIINGGREVPLVISEPLLIDANRAAVSGFDLEEVVDTPPGGGGGGAAPGGGGGGAAPGGGGGGAPPGGGGEYHLLQQLVLQFPY